MSSLRLRVLLGGGFALGAVACTALLGSFEVSPGSGADASGDLSVPDAQADGGADAATGLSAITQVTAGARHTCALGSGDRVFCWGDNSAGQLGAPVAALARSPVPVVVQGLPAIKQISAGLFHTCAVEKANPRVWCWGKNECGQLGRGSVDTVPVPSPAKIHAAAASVEVDAVSVTGGATHTCAVESGGAIYCWGCNNLGQIGSAVSNAGSPVPIVTVAGSNQSQGAAAGTKHSCAVLGAISGATRPGLACWGTEDVGALGDGPPPASVHPDFVEAQMPDAGANGVAHVAVGDAHSCATDTDQNLFCWGASDFGQAGVTAGRGAPVHVELLKRATQVAAGGSFTCYLSAAKEVVCFGANEAGQLGRGAQDTQPHPNGDNVQAVAQPGKPLLADFVAIGRTHACAVVAQGVACWGANSDGQIGDGTTGNNRNAPVFVAPPAP